MKFKEMSNKIQGNDRGQGQDKGDRIKEKY